jgi:hypothetical protein
MKSKTEANRSTPTSTDKPSGALKNSDDSNAKYSSFRPSAARLRAIALASETALLESNDEFLTKNMTEEIFTKKTVSGKSAGEFTATEDGGMAKDYPSLTEVVTKKGGFNDAYYFVSEDNANIFTNKLSEE